MIFRIERLGGGRLIAGNTNRDAHRKTGNRGADAYHSNIPFAKGLLISL